MTRKQQARATMTESNTIDFNSLTIRDYFSQEYLDEAPSRGKRMRALEEYQKANMVGEIDFEKFSMEDIGNIVKRLIEHKPNCKEEVIMKDYLGQIRTFLFQEYPTPTKHKKRIYNIIKMYQDNHLNSKSDARKEGKFSKEQQEAIGEKDLRFFFDTIEADRQKKESTLDRAEVTPNERLDIMCSMVSSALCFQNVRLTPLCFLKSAYGISHIDNTISVENHTLGKVTIIFNRLKRASEAPINVNVEDPLKTMFRKYYNKFRKGRGDHGFFFETVNKEPFTPDWFSKTVNAYLKELFPNNPIKTRMLRIMETMTALDEDDGLNYEQLEYMAYCRGHSKKEQDLYNRTEEMNKKRKIAESAL